MAFSSCLNLNGSEFLGDNFGELVVRLPDYFLRGQPEVGSPWDEDLLKGVVVNVGPFTDHSLGTCCMHRAIAGTRNGEIIVSGSSSLKEDPMKTIETAAASAAAEYLQSKQARDVKKKSSSSSSINDDERRRLQESVQDDAMMIKKPHTSSASSWRRRAAIESLSSQVYANRDTSSLSLNSEFPITGFEGQVWNEEKEKEKERKSSTIEDEVKNV